jgi:uncharacterized protein (TIGR03435 family)
MKALRPSLLVLVAILCGSLVPHSSLVRGQSAQSPDPQWQIDAGGKMAFDVASLKLNKSPDLSKKLLQFLQGGRFVAVNFPLGTYIGFAYKLNPYQSQSASAELPKWAVTERFDIEARASQPNPTQDQMRLMMQSLLSERFKLVIHTETRQVAGFGVVLEKAGKTGPGFIHLSDNAPCPGIASPSGAGAPGPAPKYDGWFTPCGGLGARFVSGRVRYGSQNVTMSQVVDILATTSMGALDPERPLFDQTGLSGKFDFMIEFTPEFHGPPPPNFQADSSGPSFFEALKDQLGLKLEATKGTVDVLVVDHVEEPTPN